jgi:hypothetical protein
MGGKRLPGIGRNIAAGKHRTFVANTVVRRDQLCAAFLSTPATQRPPARGPGFGGMAASRSVSRSTPLAKMLSGGNTVGLNKEFSLHDAIAAAGRCGFGLARSARK